MKYKEARLAILEALKEFDHLPVFTDRTTPHEQPSGGYAELEAMNFGRESRDTQGLRSSSWESFGWIDLTLYLRKRGGEDSFWDALDQFAELFRGRDIEDLSFQGAYPGPEDSDETFYKRSLTAAFEKRSVHKNYGG